jgi:hypothetical protein
MARMTKLQPFNSLPLFSDDAAIGLALLEPGRAREWKGIAQLLERRGRPKIDTLMGGRYVPTVEAFFDREYGIDRPGHLKNPDGKEDWSKWKRRRGVRKLS